MSGQIFINYRREDGRWSARSLYDRLVARFGRKQIFMDVDTLKPGVDFFRAIEKSVGTCDVLIAIIGTQWLSCSDGEGRRRLDNPEDFVRLEIAAALRREIRVIPVLLDGATMPRQSDLPDDLQLLVRRNALPVSDTGFDDDCKRLVTAIEQVFQAVETERRDREGKKRLETKRQAAEAKQRLEEERRQKKDQQRLEQPPPSPPVAPVRRRVRTGNERLWRIAGIIMLVGLVAGVAEVVVIYFIAKRQAASMAKETPQPSTSPSSVTVVTTASPSQQAKNREPSSTPKLAVAATPIPVQSTAPAEYANQKFSYALTTTTDPAQPGKAAQFTVTATNLTSSREYLRLIFHVPRFTRYRGSVEGVAVDLTPGWVSAGASVSTFIDLTVIGGNQSPPDGSVIALALVDPDRGASFSRSVTVKAVPVASLHLSTGQSTVAPGEAFSYTLAFYNPGADTLNPAQLNMQLPAGTSLVSADKGGVLGADGVVRWPLGKLARGTARQVHLNLKAPASSGAQPSLVVQAALGESVDNPLAKASDARAIYATPTFSYALTTTTDPAQPGKLAQFTVTATNLSDAREYLQFTFHVPKFTTFRNYPEGIACDLVPGWVSPGASVSTNIDLTIVGGNQSPPDGSIINLGLADLTRGASVSRSVTVRAVPTTVLKLSIGQGTVAPGEPLGYTMTYNNVSSDTLKSVQLKVQLPTGVSVVSADQGAMLSSDGAVRWPAGSIAGGTAQQVHLNLKAPAAPQGGPSLLVQAALDDGNGNLLAQASDAKAVYATPLFSYGLTTTTDPAQPGKMAQFTVTVNNLSDAKAYLTLIFRVPRFTTYHNYTEGMTSDVVPGWVNAGASVSTNIDLTVVGGNQTPPEGSIITLELRDLERGASVSRTIGINGG
jgi:uncharacterized repeat protein (TIGR01451 family)